MFYLSMGLMLTTKGDAFNGPSVSNVTNVIVFCCSKWKVSPLDIAKEQSHTTIVSMMTEELKCEESLIS